MRVREQRRRALQLYCKFHRDVLSHELQRRYPQFPASKITNKSQYRCKAAKMRKRRDLKLFFQFEWRSMTMRSTKGSAALTLAAQAARGDSARTDRIIKQLRGRVTR